MFSTKMKMVASKLQLKSKYINGINNFFVHHHAKNFSQSSDMVNDKQLTQESEPDEMPDDSLSEDQHIQVDLSVMTNDGKDKSPSLKTISVVPGKGPPPEPPITCCMSGCANCVWIGYAQELKAYYGEGAETQALEHIEDPSLKAFIKLELGLK